MATVRAQRQGLLPCEIVGVVADRYCRAVERAQEAGLNVKLLLRDNFADREEFDAAFLRTMRELRPDGLVLNYGLLLDANVVSSYRWRILNVHFSLLPLFPGFGHTRKTAEAGVRVAGATVHLVDEGMDTGPIVAQAVTALSPGLTPDEIGRKIFPVSAPAQIQAMRWMATGRIKVNDARQVEIEGARYDSLPFVPALDPDIEAFARTLS